MAPEFPKFPGLLTAIVFALGIFPSPGLPFDCEAELPSVRNAILPLWPAGKVYFEISYVFIIEAAMTMISSVTCVEFLEWTNQSDWVFVRREGPECWAEIGRTGGRQIMNLGKSCMHDHVVAHEFLHSLGFYHEHVRNDRDEHILVNFTNVRPGKEHNFFKYQGSVSTPYDIASVMHYEATVFAKDPEYPTIISLDPNVKPGGRNLTQFDAWKINWLYRHQCPN